MKKLLLLGGAILAFTITSCGNGSKACGYCLIDGEKEYACDGNEGDDEHAGNDLSDAEFCAQQGGTWHAN